MVGCNKKADHSSESTPSANSSTTANQSIQLNQAINTQSETNPTLANKQLVLSATAEFKVNNVQQTIDKIGQLTNQYAGYVAQSRISNQDQTAQYISLGNGQRRVLTGFIRRGEMIVRIPKAQVNAFLQRVQQQAVFIDQVAFTAQDVTLDIEKAELEQRIEQLKQQQYQTQSSGATQASTNSAIATALSEQQQRYAQLQAQSLIDQVNLSTIELSFIQPVQVQTRIEPDIDRSLQHSSLNDFGSQLWANLVDGWVYFARFMLWLAKGWLFLVMAFATLMAWRWWRKRKRLTHSSLAHENSDLSH